jgi:quinol monooxygenase YgiN
MSFIQIIEYETDRPEDVAALMDERNEQGVASGEQPPFTRLAVARDRENPRRFLAIVEFPSYEEAMANSERPDTHEFAQKLGALMSSGPTYSNLDVIRTVP